MRLIHEHVVPPKGGYALVVEKGDHMRITNIEGTQVVDMAVFNAENPREKLSNAWSRSRYVPEDLIPTARFSDSRGIPFLVWM